MEAFTFTQEYQLVIVDMFVRYSSFYLFLKPGDFKTRSGVQFILNFDLPVGHVSILKQSKIKRPELNPAFSTN